MICPKCQNKANATAKFCMKCGCNLAEEMGKQAAEAVETRKKSGKGFVVAFVTFVVLAAVSTVGFLVYNKTIKLPASTNSVSGLNHDAENERTVSGDEEINCMEISETAESFSLDADTLFAEPDALLAKGKEMAAIKDGMEVIESAIYQFIENAQEAGELDIAYERIADAYASYVSAVIRYKEILNVQALSGNIYSEIVSEMEKAEALADELDDKGYQVDVSFLATEKEEFIAQYTDRMITAFNEFTKQDMWPRTEAWNLMADADKMFDASDLDDPLRLRYAYALSWWIEKQLETELTNGTITAKGVAVKIANLIKDMDYNPMMIYYYVCFMEAAGEDYSAVETAYYEIIEHIYNTQGIWVGGDIDLEYFWYFNDFGEYSVDDTNGVTPENRQWIRDYMETVEFIKN